LLGELGQLFFGLANQPVTNLRDPLQIALPLFGLLFRLEFLDLLLESACPRDQILFPFPTSFERVRFLANLGQFFFDDGETLLRVRVILFLQRLLLDF